MQGCLQKIVRVPVEILDDRTAVLVVGDRFFVRLMSFPSEFLDEIRTRLSISEIVGRRVIFDRHKSNPRRKDFWGCCPFHSEKSPSFHVVEDEGFYHCFGCGAHGDLLKFVMETENLGFLEAVERLAADAGLQMPERTPQDRARAEKRKSLYDVMEMATAYYEKALNARAGEEARRYLDGRGLTPKAWERFRLGFAPREGRALCEALQKQGVTPEQLDEAGLSVKSDYNNKVQDRFRNRIIFPIENPKGQVIAFGGRAMDANARAKYLNSPETPIFHKGATLYHFGRARKAAAGLTRQGAKLGVPGLIVAEGYMDVIALALAGFEQSVAPLGTALTEDQIALAWKVTPEPVLCFDGDEAGLKAAYRSIDRALPLLKPGHSLRFAMLPDGMDPDDVVRKSGPQGMKQLFEAAIPLIDLLWQRETAEGPYDTPERRAQLEYHLEQTVSLVKDPKVRSYYQKAVRERIYQAFSPKRQSERSFKNNRMSGKPYVNSSRASTALKKSPLAQASRNRRVAGIAMDIAGARERLLVLTILTHPQLLDRHSEAFANVEIERSELDKIRCEILEIAALGDNLDKQSLKDHLVRRRVAHLADGLTSQMGARTERFLSDEAELSEAEEGWVHILAMHNTFLHLKGEAREAESAYEQDMSEENWRRIQSVQKQLDQANQTEWSKI